MISLSWSMISPQALKLFRRNMAIRSSARYAIGLPRRTSDNPIQRCMLPLEVLSDRQFKQVCLKEPARIGIIPRSLLASLVRIRPTLFKYAHTPSTGRYPK
jgi:hypothetical protein